MSKRLTLTPKTLHAFCRFSHRCPFSGQNLLQNPELPSVVSLLSPPFYDNSLVLFCHLYFVLYFERMLVRFFCKITFSFGLSGVSL